MKVIPKIIGSMSAVSASTAPLNDLFKSFFITNLPIKYLQTLGQGNYIIFIPSLKDKKNFIIEAIPTA